MNLLIPMAGAGSRFRAAGYAEPKPFIDVNGKAMIQRVVENLAPFTKPGDRLIFCVRAEYCDRMRALYPEATLVSVPDLTDGAARTVLLAKRFINDEQPVLVANSDQLVFANADNFHEKAREGGNFPFCFKPGDANPKWSYINDSGWVAEKQAISDTATCGIYYWESGAELVASIEDMIEADDRTNGELYLAPAYNHSKTYVSRFYVDAMVGLGTPEDLAGYLAGPR